MAKLLGELRGAGIGLRDLTKHYGKVEALRGANLEIEAGQFVTLLGPSGSGKTTTLMMIAGFVIPTSGDILIDGQSVVGTPAYRRNLGMVFQHYSLFPHMNVYKNIAFPLEMRRMRRPEIESRVRSALDLVRLAGLHDRRINQLSGGQQQRIALARALVFEPSVLLLDEPLGALDLKLRQELQMELLRLHERLGVTIVYVTHDQGEALTMSDRVVVMDAGAIQQVGTPEELYKRPANRFVADFIGESNFISGKGRVEGARFSLETQDGLHFVGTATGVAPHRGTLTAVVRPECIVPVLGPSDFPNVFSGVVRSMVYLGDAVKYEIGIGSETAVTAKWALRAAVNVLERGDRLQVGWAAEDMVAV